MTLTNNRMKELLSTIESADEGNPFDFSCLNIPEVYDLLLEGLRSYGLTHKIPNYVELAVELYEDDYADVGSIFELEVASMLVIKHDLSTLDIYTIEDIFISTLVDILNEDIVHELYSEFTEELGHYGLHI